MIRARGNPGSYSFSALLSSGQPFDKTQGQLTGAEVFSEGSDVVLDLSRIKAGGDGIFLKRVVFLYAYRCAWVLDGNE